MHGRSTAAKGAELASGLGAIVLGAGLALVLPGWLRAYALPLLVVGVLVHGAGMSLKYRLESRGGPPVWWETGDVLGLLGMPCRAGHLDCCGRHGLTAVAGACLALTFQQGQGSNSRTRTGERHAVFESRPLGAPAARASRHPRDAGWNGHEGRHPSRPLGARAPRPQPPCACAGGGKAGAHGRPKPGRVHLPDAPAGAPDGPGQLPHLRHGAGAGAGDGASRAKAPNCGT